MPSYTQQSVDGLSQLQKNTVFEPLPRSIPGENQVSSSKVADSSHSGFLVGGCLSRFLSQLMNCEWSAEDTAAQSQFISWDKNLDRHPPTRNPEWLESATFELETWFSPGIDLGNGSNTVFFCNWLKPSTDCCV
jgi:hypothetical protein